MLPRAEDLVGRARFYETACATIQAAVQGIDDARARPRADREANLCTLEFLWSRHTNPRSTARACSRRGMWVMRTIQRLNVYGYVLFFFALILVACERRPLATDEPARAIPNDRALLPAHRAERVAVSARVSTGYESGQEEYRVSVTISNVGGDSLEFDVAEAAFFPSGGKVLRMPTTSTQRDHVFRLAAGESDKFEWGTNGYTFDLLEDAGAAPLYFRLELKRGLNRVAGPYVAKLPHLSGLSWEETPLELSQR